MQPKLEHTWVVEISECSTTTTTRLLYNEVQDGTICDASFVQSIVGGQAAAIKHDARIRLQLGDALLPQQRVADGLGKGL